MKWWARAGRELEEVGWDVPKVEAAMVLFLDDEHRYLVTDRGYRRIWWPVEAESVAS